MRGRRSLIANSALEAAAQAERETARSIFEACLAIRLQGSQELRPEAASAIGNVPCAFAAFLPAERERGPGAFAIVAEGYGDYARAMEMKLLRELELPVVSGWAARNGAS